MLTYILFVIGFIFLIKGASYLIDGASAIAKRFNISDIVIGLTIVAFGTSAPELAVNLISSFHGNTELALGNIVGSNLANVLLILGIAAIIRPLKIKISTVWKEIPFNLLGAVLLMVLVSDVFLDGTKASFISRTDGWSLIAFFAIFLIYTFGIAKSAPDPSSEVSKLSLPKSILMVVVGLAGLTIGGQWIVDGAVRIATLMGISQSAIGLTIVAIGTSLPELAATIVASIKKQADMAIGGIIGSNIFNIFWILGVSSIVRPIPVDTSSNPSLYLNIFASFLLFIFLFIGKKHVLERCQGLMFLSFYVCYIGFIFASPYLI